MIELSPNGDWATKLTKKVRIILFVMVVAPQVLVFFLIGFDSVAIVSIIVSLVLCYCPLYFFADYYYKKIAKTWKLVINENGSITFDGPITYTIDDAGSVIYETPKYWRFQRSKFQVSRDMFPELMNSVKNA